MTRQILPIAALLLGSAFLLFAGGINALILPVRGTAEGFSSLSLGLLGTGWAVGYIAGCLVVPRLVARVGHIRSFSVMAAFAGCALLSSLLLVTPVAWIPLRAVSGFCFAGAAMIVESWLNERVDAGSRGTVFGVYTMINLAATMTGQLVLALGRPEGYTFFVIGAMFYALALVPTAVSSSASPSPLVRTSLNVRELWQNSPIAVAACFLIGISNSAFGALAAVYATQVGMSLVAVTLFASIPILAGAIAQLPVGFLSDRMDRRLVLILTALVAIAADAYFLIVEPVTNTGLLIAVALFGASIFTMYPVIVAHANDHAAPDSYVQTSGGLLLLFGIGSIFGPLMAGIAMSSFGTRGLFATTVVAHVVIVVYAVIRVAVRPALPVEERTGFIGGPMPRMTTPQTAALAPDPELIVVEAEAAETPEPEPQGGEAKQEAQPPS